MKKWIFLLVMLGAFTLSSLAQDDLYYTPTKANVARDKATYGIPADTHNSSSSRNVDEYNRRWASTYEVLPADTGDIISFAGVEGVYPDSLGDFSITQQMTRFDGYEPSNDYWIGYLNGFNDYWGWHSPWYYSSFYPWYDPWYYDPWYYSWYGFGWNSPWYYRGGYGWYDPWYYNTWYYIGDIGRGGGYGYAHDYPGTAHHGHISSAGPTGFASGRTHSFSAGTFGSSRNMGTSTATRTGTYGSSTRTTGTTITRTSTGYNNSNGNFGGSTSSGSYTPSYTPTPTPTSVSTSSSGGSFGGSRSSGGGGSFGGSRSSGGGGFGSGRR